MMAAKINQRNTHTIMCSPNNRPKMKCIKRQRHRWWPTSWKATVRPYSHMVQRVRRTATTTVARKEYNWFLFWKYKCRLGKNTYNARTKSTTCRYVNRIVHSSTITIVGNATENGGNCTTERRPHGEGNWWNISACRDERWTQQFQGK